MARLVIFKGAEGEVQGAPDVVKILPLGHVESQKGNFDVDDESLADIQKQFKSRGIDIVIDYEHQTLKDVQAPAAGWIKDIVKDGGAIAAKVEWTPQAKQYLENKEYRYLSPVVIVRQSDNKAVGLHSVALTNTPAIDGMYPIANSIDPEDYETDENGGTSNMDMEELIKQVAALLGLDANTPPEEVIKNLTDTLQQAKTQKDKEATGAPKDKEITPPEGGDKVVANKTVLGLLGLKADAKTEDVAAAIQTLKAPSSGSVSKAEFEALQLKLAKRDADEAVTKAMKAGKLAAAQKGWATDYALENPTGFASFVEKAPQGVPMGELDLETETKVNKAGTDEATTLACKMLGVSKEDLDKFGKDAK